MKKMRERRERRFREQMDKEREVRQGEERARTAGDKETEK